MTRPLRYDRFADQSEHQKPAFADDMVSDALQITRQAALTAANVYRVLVGRWQKREELVSVKRQ